MLPPSEIRRPGRAVVLIAAPEHGRTFASACVDRRRAARHEQTAGRQVHCTRYLALEEVPPHRHLRGWRQVCRHERLCVGVGGVFEHLMRGPDLDDLAEVKNDDAIGDEPDGGEVVPRLTALPSGSSGAALAEASGCRRAPRGRASSSAHRARRVMGWWRMARAMHTRCSCPPESSCGKRERKLRLRLTRVASSSTWARRSWRESSV